MRIVKGYDEDDALTVLLKESDHTKASTAQCAFGGGTLNAEIQIALNALEEAGVPLDIAATIVDMAASQVTAVAGNCGNTTTHVPRNRKKSP